MEPIHKYKTRKLVYNLIFNFHEDNHLEDPEIFDLIIMESLKNVVEDNTRENNFSESVKDNIKKFLMQAREYKDNHRKERINIINEIIGLLNTQEKDDSLIFYRMQLYDRTKIFGYLFQAPKEEIIKEIDNVHDSICYDLAVLVSHSTDVSDEEFAKEYLPELKASDLYYESLNMILRENPIVFKDQLFYNRMMCVLEYNNIIHQELINYNEKLIKKIDKKIKRIKQMP